MVDYSDYMNVSFFPFKQLWNLRNLLILGIPHFETKPDGHPSATRLDVLHVDVFTAARGQHLEGEDLLVDLIICDQLAVNDATFFPHPSTGAKTTAPNIFRTSSDK